jgi:hypothetical protein
MIIRKFILVLLDMNIFHQVIKMKQENQDILNDKMMKIGLNPELIVQGSGPAGCYGIYQQYLQVIRILKKI